MDKNIIKENLTSVLFVLISLSAGFLYLISEYKELENKKSLFNQKLHEEKIKLNNQKNEVKLMRKDLEKEILQAKLTYKNELTKIENFTNQNNSSIEKKLHNYKINTNTLINKKNLEIETLQNKINNQKSQIDNLSTQLTHIEKEKQELINFIDNINNAEKISDLISKHALEFSKIDKNTYKYYSDYMRAIDEFEAIHSLIKTYKLTNEFSPFIRKMRKKYYVNN